MIKNNNPKYKLQYKGCNNDKNHTDQALNFVCLNEDCREHSLICSMCRNQKHQGHFTQPLKFYIEQLKKDYQTGARDFQKELQALEQLRATFLYKLKVSIEKIAEEFQRLEEDVIQHFQLMRSQLIQQESKKNKFMDFYESLISEQGEKPEFLIQNYLPKKQHAPIKNIDHLEKLSSKITALVTQTNTSFFDQTFKQSKILQTADLFQVADTVKVNKNVFQQSNAAMGSKCMNILKVDLMNQFGKGKIRIKITKLKKGGFVYVGAIQKDYFDSLKQLAPGNWLNNGHNGKLFFVNNTGQSFGHVKNQVKAFSQGSNLNISVQENKLKVGMKKGESEFNLPKDGNKYYFFFALLGLTEIEVNYHQ